MTEGADTAGNDNLHLEPVLAAGPMGRTLVMILALLVVALPASAEPTADEKEQARGHMDLGRKHFADGDFKAALQAYEAADKIMDVPTTSFSVGVTLDKLGRLIEARDRLLTLARSKPVGNEEPSSFGEARKRAKDLAQDLAVRIPSVRVEVLSFTGDAIENATITIAGKDVETAASKLPMRVDPGQVKVSANAAEHTTAEREVDVEEGEHHVITLVLVARAGEAPTQFVVSPFAYVGIGLAVGGAIAGAAMGSAALAKSATLAESCPGNLCPPELEDTADTMELFAHISTASFAVAGAGAALAIIGFVFLSGEEPLDSAQLDADGLTIRF